VFVVGPAGRLAGRPDHEHSNYAYFKECKKRKIVGIADMPTSADILQQIQPENCFINIDKITTNWT
jgi:hypothetical protein